MAKLGTLIDNRAIPQPCSEWPGRCPLRIIVESPRGSSIKLEHDPDLDLFTVSRELPLGVVYPFDWGFIPGTRGEDGDPLDAMALHHSSTYPGVLLPCRILGMVEVVRLRVKRGSAALR